MLELSACLFGAAFFLKAAAQTDEALRRARTKKPAQTLDGERPFFHNNGRDWAAMVKMSGKIFFF